MRGQEHPDTFCIPWVEPHYRCKPVNLTSNEIVKSDLCVVEIFIVGTPLFVGQEYILMGHAFKKHLA